MRQAAKSAACLCAGARKRPEGHGCQPSCFLQAYPRHTRTCPAAHRAARGLSACRVSRKDRVARGVPPRPASDTPPARHKKSAGRTRRFRTSDRSGTSSGECEREGWLRQLPERTGRSARCVECVFDLRLGGQALGFPGAPAADQGAGAGPAGPLQLERHTGTRRLVRSSTVRDDPGLWRQPQRLRRADRAFRMQSH